LADDKREDDLEGWLEEFRPGPSERALYQAASARAGLEMAHWARQTLNNVARSILDDERAPSGAAADGPEFAAVFQGTPLPLLLLAPDGPRFTILAVNDAYLRATMSERKQLLGRSALDAIGHGTGDGAEGWAAALRDSLARVVALRRPDSMGVRKLELERPDERGGGVEERHLSRINVPVIGAAGQVLYVLHRVQDISDLVFLEHTEKTQQGLIASFRALASERQQEIVRRAREASLARELLQQTFEVSGADLPAVSREVAARGGDLNAAIEDLRAREQVQHFLSDATASLAESLELRETLARVARLPVPVFADWCLLDLFDEHGQLRRADVAHAEPADAPLAAEVLGYPVQAGPGAARGDGSSLPAGAPVLIEASPDDVGRAGASDDHHQALVKAVGGRSLISVALRARSRTLGFLTFVTGRSGRLYRQADVSIAEDIGRRCALAIENARLFEEARGALRVRDDFLSVASHALRTPLTPLQLQVSSLERRFREFVKIGKESWLEDRLTTIKRQTDRLERLVEELGEMSHIVEATVSLWPEPLVLAEVVDQVVAHFDAEERVAAERCPITAEVPGAIVGRWDRARLGQVLASLLSNAQRHSPGKPIALTASLVEGAVIIAVADSRSDVGPRDHQRAFGGLDSGVPLPNYGGLGLGLFVTRQIVDAMGGTVEVSSGPHAGATFTLRLPLDAPVPGSLNDAQAAAAAIH
jgi:signal transduction histidine kinase/PAS domain-containing protein